MRRIRKRSIIADKIVTDYNQKKRYDHFIEAKKKILEEKNESSNKQKHD